MANRRYASLTNLPRWLLALFALRIVFNHSTPPRPEHYEINGSCLRKLPFSLRDVDAGLDKNFYSQHMLLKDYGALLGSKHPSVG